MNKSTKEIGQPEQQPNSKQTDDNSTSASLLPNPMLCAVLKFVKL
jgi:hypothetical protein